MHKYRRGRVQGARGGGSRAFLLATAAAGALVAGQWVAAMPAGAAPAAPAGPAAPLGQLSPALAATLSQNVTNEVIVVMKTQPAAAQAGTQAAAQRANAVGTDQPPVMTELAQVKATHIQRYTLVNAVAATVSPAEAQRLAANSGCGIGHPRLDRHRQAAGSLGRGG